MAHRMRANLQTEPAPTWRFVARKLSEIFVVVLGPAMLHLMKELGGI